jgi:DNA-binding MarR family transcriptional regulator
VTTRGTVHFDERSDRPYAAGVSDPVRAVQTWYPQIYLACHDDHKRARRTRTGISDRDSSILAHLDERVPMTAAALAQHVGIGRPAMSATIKRLLARGLITQQTDANDARRRQLHLTAAGRRALGESSVLDTVLLRGVLRRLTPSERARALDGLSLLARAARESMLNRP